MLFSRYWRHSINIILQIESNLHDGITAGMGNTQRYDNAIKVVNCDLNWPILLIFCLTAAIGTLLSS